MQVERSADWASSTAEIFFNTEYPRFFVSTKFILDSGSLFGAFALLYFLYGEYVLPMFD